MLSDGAYGNARTKLGSFHSIASAQMAADHMRHSNPLMVLFKLGKKKNAFGKSGIVHASEAMKAVRDIAEHHGVQLFLISGSLLGPVRDGDLLAHDYDVDFGVFAGDRHMPKLHKSLEDDRRMDVRVFRITPELALYNPYFAGRAGEPLKYTIKFKGAITIDIFVHVSHEDTVYHGTDRNMWTNSTFDLAPLEFAGSTYLAPRDADRYLTENYGEWRVPVKDYHAATDTPNVGTVVSYRAVVTNIRNYLRFKKAGDDMRASVMHEQLNAMRNSLKASL